jgi:hypothetical protein
MAKPVRFRGKWRIRPIGEDGERESYVFDTYAEALRKLKSASTRSRRCAAAHAIQLDMLTAQVGTRSPSS